MRRAITLCTWQWADLPLATVAEKAASWGYDGLELACAGDHMNVEQAAADPDYCASQKAILAGHGLELFSISNHLAGHLTLDQGDERTNSWAPTWCAGDPEKKRQWGIANTKEAALAAKNLGLRVVNSLSGSPIWHLLYRFPPVPDAMIEEGFQGFAEIWNPILDVYDERGVRLAYEVHPTSLAFDLITAERMLAAVNNRKTIGFNFDPSHLHWQRVDPLVFLREFSERIYHVHLKDASVNLDGRSSILCSHLNFGQPDRGWDFRSLGHGGVDFEAIIRELNQIGYTGPLSVEWEDSGMDRERGAREACEFAGRLAFAPSGQAFDAAFGE